MKRFLFLLFVALSFQTFADERPNVVLIFIDDMGYGDVGFNGAKGPKTPNLDQMAAEGMRFDHFYVGCSVCTGSRTSLMTGCYYERLSMRPVLFPNSDNGLHPDEMTIADMLKAEGYRTACVGKWHLGHLPPCLPTYQGFDSYYGIPYSNDMWIDPANKLSDSLVVREGLSLDQVKAGHKKKNWVPLMKDEEVIEYPVDQTTVTKRFTEEAIRFISEKKDEPFFLYLPHTMVHLPLAVSEAFENRTEKLIWGAIEEVDWSVGQILTALKELGIDKNTLVIFTSDNGAAVGSSLPLRAKKGSVYEGGVREPTVMWWPGKIPANTVCEEVSATIDVLPTLASLCDAKLPDRKIDGKDISSLMLGEEGSKSPHKYYTLMHQGGAVRSGSWKYYPWPEKNDKRGLTSGRKPSSDPVQLYNVVEDIGEKTNLASKHPDLVKKFQTAFENHVKEINANTRSNIEMVRPENPVASPDRPGGAKTKPGKPINWSSVSIGDVYQSNRAPNFANKAFSISAKLGDVKEGVIVSHGGSVVGYSLYISNDRECVFTIRTDKNQVYRVSASVSGDVVGVKCGIDTNREMFLQIGNREPVRAPGKFLLKHPSESLCIGKDEQNPVDEKSPSGVFKGAIEKLMVEEI